MEKPAKILCICHSLTKLSSFMCFYYIFTHVSVQNVQSEHFDCAKEVAFRKSDPGVGEADFHPEHRGYTASRRDCGAYPKPGRMMLVE